MKQFLIKVVLFLAVLAIAILPFNMIIDPYNVFHTEQMRDNGVEPNKNYLKTKYIVENPEKFDSYLFGSSRVGFIDVERLTDGNYYNMMYSEGLPKEHLHTLQTFLAKGEVPKNVIIGVDDISYMVPPEWHEGQLYRLEYPFMGSIWDKAGFFIRYFDTITTLQSLATIRDYGEPKEERVTRFYATGTEELDGTMQFNEANNTPYWAGYYEPRLEEVMGEMQEIVTLCEENNIKLTVFTNPIHATTYTADVEYGYLDFLEALAEVTPYYNFSGFNDITTNNEYYFETSHYKSTVGNMMIDAVFKGEASDTLKQQGFGVLVTDENKEEVMQILRQQADERQINY